MKRKWVGLSVIAAIVFFFLSSIVFAQLPTGMVSGVVIDETGAVVPGAEVTARHLDTGVSRVVMTDGEGRYRVPSLALGPYEIEVSQVGFRPEVHSGIELTLGRQAVVDFTLRVGAVTEKITVTGDAPLVQTENSSVGELVTEVQLERLPLNGRSLDQLAVLQPGVSFHRYGAKGASTGFTAKMTVHGARPSQNKFRWDGIDITSAQGRTPGGVSGFLLGTEAVREFRIESSSYSAKFGSGGGAVVNIATKSGTNEFHGTVYDFHRNDDLDARNFF